MRKPFQISVEIPSSVACKLEGKEVKCEKGSVVIERHFPALESEDDN